MSLDVTIHSDPGCPWAYSASPALALLQWRYGEGLRWRLVTIGLTESGRVYEERGYTPVGSARGYARFRRFGMPFSTGLRDRICGTSAACRALQAVRIDAPGREWAAFRALQFAWFTTPLLVDEPDAIATALATVPGLDGAALAARIEDDDVRAAYEADRAEARTAAGTPTEFQDKHANTDGAVRYTAPSIVFTAADGRTLEAGGFQSREAYDVCIANLDTTLPRRGAPEHVGEILQALPDGLTTAEVAEILTPDKEPVDRAAAEYALIGFLGDGGGERLPLGDDALWRLRD